MRSKKINYCCKDIQRYLIFNCDQCKDRYACPDVLIEPRKDGTMGIIVHDGGSSSVMIRYCPWCGKKLQ